MFQIYEKCFDGYENFVSETNEIFVTKLEAEERCDELNHFSSYGSEYFIREV